MEYIILWIFALFGIWSLISNIVDSIYCENKVGIFDISVEVQNQEDCIEELIRQLEKIELVGNIHIIDKGSVDATVDIIKNIQKENARIYFEKK